MKATRKDKELRGFIYDTVSTKIKRCLYPGVNCKNKLINAHSIQNSKVLDVLSDNGYVVMLNSKPDLSRLPVTNFEPIGKNKATTFTGLCNEHDTTLFKPIDQDDIEPKNKEQMFLLAYRSVTRQYHDRITVMSHFRDVFNKGAELNHNDMNSNEVLLKGLVNLFIIENRCNIFHNYKAAFDYAYLNQRYNDIEHYCRIIRNAKPTLAVSSVIDFDEDANIPQKVQDPHICVLNIFPQKSNLVIVISFKRSHKSALWPYFSELDNADDKDLLYWLSKLILIHCENFVLSPQHFESFSDRKKQVIKKYFRESMDWKEWDDPDLFLF